MGKNGGRMGSLPRALTFLPLLFPFLAPILPFPPLLPISADASQQPTFQSRPSELVVLPVVVTDKRGQLVADLDRDRFVVYDNGRRVPIELFSNEDTPVTVGLVIDTSSSMRKRLGEVIAATMRFASSSHPQDELFVIRFNDDARYAVRERQFLLAGDRGDLERAMM